MFGLPHRLEGTKKGSNNKSPKTTFANKIFVSVKSYAHGQPKITKFAAGIEK
jgi:hypothetical protein